MLARLHLEDFKSFVDQEIALSPFTLLVGANASGKSNLLDAVRFLQGLAAGLTVEQVLNGQLEGGRQTWPGIRGGAAEVGRARRSQFRIEAEWHLDHHAFVYKAAVGVNGAPRLTSEEIDPPNQDQGVATRRGDPPSRQSVLRLLGGGWFEGEGLMKDALTGVTLLDLRPEQMRHHVPKARASIGASGENLSAAVWQLAQDPERKKDLIYWLSELCSPSIADIEFDETSLLEEVMIVLVETDGTKVSARTLSDGTLRFLGTLVALLTMEPSDTLLIEEIEAGLHPSRVHLLVDLAEEITRDGERQVIATTHSPSALLALSAAGIRNAVVFGRVIGREGTIMRRLGDLPRFDEAEAREGIDELFTSRWLEQAL